MSFIRQNKDLETRFIEIDEESANQRLDNFLLRQLKKVPKSHVYRIVRSGEVRVNKGRKKPDYRLKKGDLVRIPPVKNVSSGKPSIGHNIDWLLDTIQFEDEHLMVINKPSGMAVHGGSGLSFGIIEALRKLRPELRFLELVHRLDRETSGVLLLAKKRSALRLLHEYLRNNQFIKHYTALIEGVMADQAHDVVAPLKKITRSGERVVVVDPEGKESRSYFRRESVYEPGSQLEQGATLVDIRLFTGRTHQARVHAASFGHPIAGDEKYGNRDFNVAMKSLGLKRLFLHARWLQFPHPATSNNIKIEAPMPDDLADLLRTLENDPAI